MSISRECIHTSKFKKDCCEVIWNGTIVEHDGCMANGGCDLVAYNDDKFLIIEIKGGRISSGDATKIVQQIEECEKFYSNFIGHRRKSKIFLHCNSKRIDDFAREKLKRAKIRIYRCHNSIDLNNFII